MRNRQNEQLTYVIIWTTDVKSAMYNFNWYNFISASIQCEQHFPPPENQQKQKFL